MEVGNITDVIASEGVNAKIINFDFVGKTKKVELVAQAA